MPARQVAWKPKGLTKGCDSINASKHFVLKNVNAHSRKEFFYDELFSESLESASGALIHFTELQNCEAIQSPAGLGSVATKMLVANNEADEAEASGVARFWLKLRRLFGKQQGTD